MYSSSLRKKLGQLIMMDFRYWGENPDSELIPFIHTNSDVKQLFQDYNLGGFILFKENIQDNEQTISLLRNLQSSLETPLFFATDQEGGRVNRLKQGTSGCGNMAIAATKNPNNAYTMSKLIGDELYSLGINTNFAPVIDVNCNKNNPIIGVRAYSDDAETVTQYASKSISGLADANIISCVKHFPGHGDTATDTHHEAVTIAKPLKEIEQVELYPFKELSNQYDIVMTAHISVPSLDDTKYKSIATGEQMYLPATLSHKIITKLLKDDIGFKGLVVSDAMDMKAIATHLGQIEATKLAILAGVDVVLMPVRVWSKNNISKLEELFLKLEKEYSNNQIFAEAVDIAYTKVTNFKLNKKLHQAPIFTHTLAQQISLADSIVDSNAHKEIAFDIAKQSTTIVKNNGLIPYQLNTKDTLLIIDSDNDRLKEFANLLKVKDDRLNIVTKNINDASIKESVFEVNIVVLISTNLKEHSHKYSHITSIASHKTINIAAINPYDIDYIDNVENYVCIYGASSIDQTNYTRTHLEINMKATIDNIFKF